MNNKQRYRQLNPQELKRLFEQGVTLKQLCKHFRAGEQAVKRNLALQKLSIQKRQRPFKRQPKQDLIGYKFNFLTIESFEHDPMKKDWWMKVRCDCGNLGRESLRKLQQGLRKTCGKKGCPHFHKVRQTNGRSGNFTGYEEIYGSRWDLWKINAHKRGLVFNITPKYAWELFIKQERKCVLTGVVLEFGTSWNRKSTASLDRINSSKGYVAGNIQWVHKQINVMKRSSSDEDFIEWCKLVVNNQRTTANKRTV